MASKKGNQGKKKRNKSISRSKGVKGSKSSPKSVIQLKRDELLRLKMMPPSNHQKWQIQNLQQEIDRLEAYYDSKKKI